MKQQNLRSTWMIIFVMIFLASSPTTAALASPDAKLQDASSGAASQQGQDLERIRFARGTTSAVVSDDLAAKKSDRYILRAMAGQLMDVTLSDSEGAKLSVTTESGRALKAITSSSTSFRGYLPSNGNYILTVKAGRKATSYSLSVSIPERISFERGTTSATIEDDLGEARSHDYILRAGEGQLMEINVESDDPDEDLQLIIYGVDGTVLRSGMGEGSSFRGELPEDQDYVVTVRAEEDDVSFTMDVIIPVCIKFDPGDDSDSEKGKLKAYRSQYYVLRALKNQTMQVDVTSGGDVQLIIYGADGTVLKSGMGEGASFKGKLPGTQDYVLVVRSGAKSVSYTLRVKVR